MENCKPFAFLCFDFHGATCIPYVRVAGCFEHVRVGLASWMLKFWICVSCWWEALPLHWELSRALASYPWVVRGYHKRVCTHDDCMQHWRHSKKLLWGCYCAENRRFGQSVCANNECLSTECAQIVLTVHLAANQLSPCFCGVAMTCIQSPLPTRLAKFLYNKLAGTFPSRYQFPPTTLSNFFHARNGSPTAAWYM